MYKNRTLNERTLVWAHRGASAYAPENTLPAFALAVEMEADGVELDGHLSKDGKIVVHHNFDIWDPAIGKAYIRDLTYDEVAKYNVNNQREDIIEKYYYFRLEDVALCFKKGRVDSNYRKFYGRLDGSVFLEWFARYDKERESVLQSHPSNNQTIPLISQGIPWEQYREDLMKKVEEGDEEAKKQLEAMESVRRRFEADRGQLFNYRYNQKHKFDDK